MDDEINETDIKNIMCRSKNPEEAFIIAEVTKRDEKIKRLLKEALDAVLGRCKDIEKVVFALFYGYFGVEKRMTAMEIGRFLQIEGNENKKNKYRRVYSINEKIERNFIKELNK